MSACFCNCMLYDFIVLSTAIKIIITRQLCGFLMIHHYQAFLTFYSSTKVMVVCTKQQFVFVSICLTFTFDLRHTKTDLLNTGSFKLAAYLPTKAKLHFTGLLPRDIEYDTMHEVVIGLGRSCKV